jgi:hypothetical protein
MTMFEHGFEYGSVKMVASCEKNRVGILMMVFWHVDVARAKNA